MAKQVVPLQPMEDYGGADIHLASCGGPHTGAGEQHEKEGVIEIEVSQSDHYYILSYSKL